MAKVKLIVTGDMERLALAESLRRVFPPHRDGEPVQWDRPRKLHGATSHRLRADRPPSRAMLDLARAMLDEVGIGKRGQPADLVVVVDDVELANLGQEALVVDCFRRAVLEQLDDYEAPTRSRYRVLLRERCSFHLLKPMVESYLFGDAQALARAGVPRSRRPRLACSDVEEFETDDPDPEWRRTCQIHNQRRRPKLSWWRHERHPKHYLEHLTRASVTYEETLHGKDALSTLEWRRVFGIADETGVLRSLFEDLADWFRIANPVGEGWCHERLYPACSVDRTTLLLRNL